MMKPRFAYAAGLQRLADFTRDRGGNVAMIFGITLLPFTFLIGAAIDYSGASDLRTRLQRATDATGLQLCQLANNLSSGDYLSTARDKLLPSYLGTQPFSIKSFDVTENPHRIKLVTSAVYNTAVVRIMGSSYNTIPVDAEAQCQNQPETFEIALVLDNTGSMADSGGGAQSKMEALKEAAKKFVEYVYTTPKLAKSKISIVPFAAAVRLDHVKYRNEIWIDRQGKSSYHWNFIQGGAAATAMSSSYVKNRLDVVTYLKASVPSWDWNGCFESLPYPLNTSDGKPDPANLDSYYVPMFYPDESGTGGARQNSYINDGDGSGFCPSSGVPDAQLNGQACKYVGLAGRQTATGWGPNASCTSRALTRLTDDKTVLLNEIAQMQPSGNTNIHQGAFWGWQTLAPANVSVLGDGVAYDTPYHHKILIIMTDGMNTWDPNPGNATLLSRYSAYGFFRNPDLTTPNNRLPAANANPTTGAAARNAIDA